MKLLCLYNTGRNSSPFVFDIECPVACRLSTIDSGFVPGVDTGSSIRDVGFVGPKSGRRPPDASAQGRNRTRPLSHSGRCWRNNKANQSGTCDRYWD
jgi:hypothetical protein